MFPIALCLSVRLLTIFFFFREKLVCAWGLEEDLCLWDGPEDKSVVILDRSGTAPGEFWLLNHA